MSEAELVARLERLERSNRSLKRVALVAVVLLAATVGLGAAYATPPIPQKIVAHEFDLVDGSGSSLLTIGSDGAGRPHVWLRKADGKAGIFVEVGENGPEVCVTSGQGSACMKTSESGSPKVVLHDSQGFEMDLGSADLVTPTTGETRQTSAASIVMFGNDKKHHVIWQAPN